MLSQQYEFDLKPFNAEIPESWDLIPLEKAGDVVYGIQASVANNLKPIGTKILTNKNITLDGKIVLDKINYFELSTERHFRTLLSKGDLLFNWRSGSKEHVGKTAFFELDGEYTHSSFILRIRANKKIDRRFLYFYLNYLRQSNYFIKLQTYAINAKFNKSAVNRLPVILPPLDEQKRIAYVLSTVQRAISQQEQIIQNTTELKKALMYKLFTEGLHGEKQKETEIGPIPTSWELATIESQCSIKASSMTYKQLENFEEDGSKENECVFGIKVSDMNLEGNEVTFNKANLIKQLPKDTATKKTVPANSIIFPKRGAAIATNKKRLTTCWTVLDPNLIAVTPSQEVDHRFLFHWFNTFDLARITDPGPTPQLNKKDIAPLKFPFPDKETQKAVANSIDAVDKKMELHMRKLLTLNELFRTLLHQLMTAEVRVHDIDLPGFDNSVNITP